MQTKKQEARYLGYHKTGKFFVTNSFMSCFNNSLEDPRPLNRKARRSMGKEIRRMFNEQESNQTNRIQKKERKERRKAVQISRKKNR